MLCVVDRVMIVTLMRCDTPPCFVIQSIPVLRDVKVQEQIIEQRPVLPEGESVPGLK